MPLAGRPEMSDASAEEEAVMRRRRPLALAGIGVLSILLVGVAYRATRNAPAPVAVRTVPRLAQAEAVARLSAAGLRASAPPVWAGARPEWQVPGRYRLFFAAPARDGGTDIYRAEAQVDGDGRVARVTGAVRLTHTPAGDETAPVLTDGWLAFTMRVGDRYQAVTCMPLTDLRHMYVFAFTHPAVQVHLAWQEGTADGAAQLAVRAMLPTGGVEMSIDPTVPRVQPAGADLQYQPAR